MPNQSQSVLRTILYGLKLEMWICGSAYPMPDGLGWTADSLCYTAIPCAEHTSAHGIIVRNKQHIQSGVSAGKWDNCILSSKDKCWNVKYSYSVASQNAHRPVFSRDHWSYDPVPSAEHRMYPPPGSQNSALDCRSGIYQYSVHNISFCETSHMHPNWANIS